MEENLDGVTEPMTRERDALVVAAKDFNATSETRMTCRTNERARQLLYSMATRNLATQNTSDVPTF